MFDVNSQTVAPVLAGTATVIAAVCALHLFKLWGSKDAPPGPAFFIPKLGEMPEFLVSPLKHGWVRYKRYKTAIFKTHVMGLQSIMVGDYELLRGPLSDSEYCEPDMPIPTFTTLMGKNYSRVGETHKSFRKHMMDAIGPMALPNIYQELLACVNKHVSDWMTSAAKEETVRIDHLLRQLMIDLGLHPIAGLPTQPEEVPELLDMAAALQAGLFCVPIYLPGTQWYKAYNMKKPYLKKLVALLEKRFPPETPGGLLKLESDTGAPPGADTTKALFQEFIDMGCPLDAAELAQRTAVNLVGATETTASSMLALMIMTGVMPDVQRKIREEQAGLLRSSGSTITWQDVHQGMPYTEACVREVLRLYPSAHGIFRLMKKDAMVGGYKVKAGEVVTLGFDLMYAIDAERIALKAGYKPGSPETGDDKTPPSSLDSNNWRESFRPERWLESEGSRMKLHLFGHGKWSCIGKDLSMLEMKLVLATLARQATWELVGCDNPIISFVPWIQLSNGQPVLRIKPAPLEV